MLAAAATVSEDPCSVSKSRPFQCEAILRAVHRELAQKSTVLLRLLHHHLPRPSNPRCSPRSTLSRAARAPRRSATPSRRSCLLRNRRRTRRMPTHRTRRLPLQSTLSRESRRRSAPSAMTPLRGVPGPTSPALCCGAHLLLASRSRLVPAPPPGNSSRRPSGRLLRRSPAPARGLTQRPSESCGPKCNRQGIFA